MSVCAGFGQTGPYAKRAGYDNIAAAVGGLMHITGPQVCVVCVSFTPLKSKDQVQKIDAYSNLQPFQRELIFQTG